MLHPIVINALISGILIALCSSPLGCFLVWRRLSSFSDAVSHIALPGIAIGIVFGVSSFICSVVSVFITALIVGQMKERGRTSANSLVVAFAEIGLGLGMMILALSNKSSRFEVLLFGDILSITTKDIIYIVLVFLVSSVTIFKIKEKLLLSILCEDIALSEGINTKKLNLIFMLLLSIVVAVSIKTVGILLVSSLLIIPAVISRLISKNYNQMILFSSIIGMVGVFLGVLISFKIDVPPIPAIVSMLGFFLFMIFFVQILIKCFKKMS